MGGQLTLTDATPEAPGRYRPGALSRGVGEKAVRAPLPCHDGATSRRSDHQGGNVDLAAVWQRVRRAVRRESGIFSEVGADEKATGEAVVVAIGAAMVGGLGALWPGEPRFAAGSWITTAIGTGTLGLAIGVGVIFLIGRLFKSQGTYVALFRAAGYASAPSALGIVPVIGGIAGAVWSIVLMVRAVKETQGVTDGAATAIVLIPVAVGIILGALLFAALFAAFLGFAAAG